MKFTEVIDFLREKSTDDECPSCKTHEWLLEAAEEGEITHTPGLVIGTIKEDDAAYSSVTFSARPTITMVCKNCGFIRLYSYNFIRDWVKSKGGAA